MVTFEFVFADEGRKRLEKKAGWNELKFEFAYGGGEGARGWKLLSDALRLLDW